MHPKFDANLVDAPSFLGVGNGSHAIYVLYDEDDGGVRYVGVTTSPELRAAAHFEPKTGNRYLMAWKRSGGRPVFRLVDGASGGSWEMAERAWIAYFRRLGFIYNMHEGGVLERGRFKGVRDPWMLYKSQHVSSKQLRDFKGKLPMSPEQKADKRAKQKAKNERRRQRKLEAKAKRSAFTSLVAEYKR